MIARRALARLAAAIAMLCFTPAARAQDEPVIPDYQGYVTDVAGVLSGGSHAKLEAFLDQVQKKTGAQFAVLIVPTTAPLEPSDYKTQVFDRWKIGEKGKDNGLLLLVAMHERKAIFETGYGLEGVLPDGMQARIVREQIASAMKAGDADGAVTAGVIAAAARIAADQNVTLEWDGRELHYTRSSPIWIPPWWLPLLIVILIARVLRMFVGRRGGWWWMGPGGFGGYSGWGGGFGGFGGFGGGGGGGGGSFGGFGGGSSGGGGGGGSW